MAQIIDWVEQGHILLSFYSSICFPRLQPLAAVESWLIQIKQAGLIEH